MTSVLPVSHLKDMAERKVSVKVICANKRVTVEIVSDLEEYVELTNSCPRTMQ